LAIEVEILAIVAKSDAEAWLTQFGTPADTGEDDEESTAI
jgi:hypothetical protein